jgi:ATP synthase F1 delta subunit
MNSGHMISKRYALAFLNTFPFAPETLEDIKQAIIFLDQHDEVFLMLKIPLLDAAKKAQALEDYLIGRFKLPESFRRLIAVLIAQKRTFLINDILRWIVQLYEERAGIELFEVRTPILLDDADRETIKQFLAEKTNHTITIKQEQDDELIAGIRLQSTQHVWECSIRKQLAAVERQLKD